ncbi:MAG TPA: hypothetical protein VG733_07560 [Chthoniobacteraceae bacterium]|nr:hypothetical protein [Chthoniobacteraceae bacterium]
MRHAAAIIGKWLVIAAMFSAFGGHWMLLQSVAWTTMVIDNVKHASLGEALERTFDGQHPCALCKTIAKERQSQKEQDLFATFGKINLFYECMRIVVVSPRPCMELSAWECFAPQRGDKPLLRPPRLRMAA